MGEKRRRGFDLIIPHPSSLIPLNIPQISMKRVVIIGAGGHGREVAEILRQQIEAGDRLTLLGFIDENSHLRKETRDGLQVLGGWEYFEGVDRNDVSVICGVGLPQVLRRLALHAESLNLNFVNAVSPLAHVSPYARLGRGVVMFPNTVANTNSFIEDYSILNVSATVSHDSKIGHYSNINPGAHLAGNVTIGEGCYIGMGANVIQGKRIGEWSIVGAGAIVVEDLPANVTAVGVPAKIIKQKEKGWHE